MGLTGIRKSLRAEGIEGRTASLRKRAAAAMVASAAAPRAVAVATSLQGKTGSAAAAGSGLPQKLQQRRQSEYLGSNLGKNRMIAPHNSAIAGGRN